MMLRGNFGLAALLTGDTDAARDAFREELVLCRELVVRPFAVRRPPRPRRGRRGRRRRPPRRAARRRRGRPCYGQPQDVVEARLDAAFFDAARTRFGADAWEAAGRDGAALSFEDAIAYALEERRA